MYKILMVDDDSKNLKATQIFLKSAGYEVLTTTSPTEAIELTKADEFALALLDYQMPEMKGDALALMIRQVNPHQQIAMYSCDLSREAVKFSMKAGALDFIEKTIAPEELLKLIESYCNKYDILWRTVRPTKDKSETGKLIESVGMIGQSKVSADIAAIIHKVAGVDTSVLIRGESGTGKELVARAIHKLSPRSAKGHFVALNCGAFPKDLLESELFGHVKGSFSGAVNDQMGKFEVANNGTIFLDEIGDMPLDLQVKLLRVLQEREFVPVGGKFPKKVNVRILAATNKNIDDMVVKGIFREDFMYRIKVFEIELQPLRNRIEDIEPLVAHFTEFFNKKNNTNKFFQKRTIELLKKNIWSGNVRELQGTVERHMITSSGNLIRPEDLDLKFYEATSPVVSGITMDQYWNQMADDEIRFLQNAIEKTGGNKAEAARRLNITPRHLQHLLNKTKDTKIENKTLEAGV